MNDSRDAPDDLAAVVASLRGVEETLEREGVAPSVRAQVEQARQRLQRVVTRSGRSETAWSFSPILDDADVGAWVWKVRSGEVIWSSTLERLHGLQPGTFGGTFEAYQSDIHPEDRERVLATIQNTLARRSDHRLHYRIVRPDGEIRWLEARGRVVCDADGEPMEVRGVCTDVTERRAAELALHETESWLATTLASIGDGVVATDFQGRVRFLNAVAADLMGITPEQATGRPLEEVFRIVHEQTRKPAENPVAKALRLDDIVGLANHTLLLRPDGSELAIDDSAAPIRDPKGNTVGVVLVFRDVTEKRQEEAREAFIAQATAELASSLDYDATIANIVRLAVPRVSDWVAIDVLDETGALRRIGVAHVDPRKVELAHDLSRRWPPDPQAKQGVHQVLRTGQTEWMAQIPEGLLDSLARDAEHLEVIRALGLRSYVCAPIRARGHILGAVTFVNAESGRSFDERDVKLAEELAHVAAVALLNAQLHRQVAEALERTSVARDRAALLQRVTARLAGAMSAEEVAQTAVGMAHDVVDASASVMYVREGNTFRLAAYREIPASVGQHWPTLPLDAPLPLAKAVATGEAQWLDRSELLEQYPHLSQSDVPAERLQAVVALPVVMGDSVLGGIAFSFRSARSFEEDERALLLAMTRQFALALDRVGLVEGLQRTVRFSEMFVGILGHDLRNPLGAITIATQILRESVGSDERQLRSVARIDNSAQRMSRMIEQLLDFTRIRLGEGIPIRPIQTDASELCRRVVAEFEGLHGGELTVRCRGDMTVSWDADRITQALSNLVSNALQHRDTGSQVTVHLDGVQPDVVQVEVTNPGVIPDQLLPQLFEPLAGRKETRTTTGTRGLGLGLYIAQEIAVAHGGRIEATCSAGDRTVSFTLRLPRRARAGMSAVFGGKPS